jgi:hypothetical protein
MPVARRQFRLAYKTPLNHNRKREAKDQSASMAAGVPALGGKNSKAAQTGLDERSFVVDVRFSRSVGAWSKGEGIAMSHLATARDPPIGPPK